MFSAGAICRLQKTSNGKDQRLLNVSTIKDNSYQRLTDLSFQPEVVTQLCSDVRIGAHIAVVPVTFT